MTAIYGMRYKHVFVVLRKDTGETIPTYMHRYWWLVKRLASVSLKNSLTMSHITRLLCDARRATSEKLLGCSY